MLLFFENELLLVLNPVLICFPFELTSRNGQPNSYSARPIYCSSLSFNKHGVDILLRVSSVRPPPIDTCPTGDLHDYSCFVNIPISSIYGMRLSSISYSLVITPVVVVIFVSNTIPLIQVLQ